MSMAEGNSSTRRAGVESQAILSMSFTNDLGEFRLHSLPPGEYYVAARLYAPAGGLTDGPSRAAYVTTYYPGAAMAAEGQRISLAAGAQMIGANFALVRTNTATVSGVIVDAAGQLIAVGSVTMTPVGIGVADGGYVSQGAGGRFSFPLVSPGAYVLQAAAGGGRGGGGGLAVAPASVQVAGQDISNIQLVATPGTTVTGKVVFDESVPASLPLNVLYVTASSTEATVSTMSTTRTAQPNRDGNFALTGLAGRQLLRIQSIGSSLPPDVAMKAVRLNGEDITDTGFDFTGRNSVQGLEVGT